MRSGLLSGTRERGREERSWPISVMTRQALLLACGLVPSVTWMVYDITAVGGQQERSLQHAQELEMVPRTIFFALWLGATSFVLNT